MSAGLDVVGGAPVSAFSGAFSTGETYNEDAESAFVATSGTDAIHRRAGAMLEELIASANVAGAIVGDVLPNARETIIVSGEVASTMTFAPGGDSSASFRDSVAAAWQMMLSDGATGTDESIGTVQRRLAAADALAATAMADSRLSAMAACAVAAALEDLVTSGWSMDAIDSAALADSAAAKLRALVAAADAAAVADGAAGSLRLSLVAAESAQVDDSPAAALSGLVNAASGAMAYVSVRIGATDYSGWVVNADLRAVTEYRNVPFESLATFRGMHYAAGPNGIFQLTGDTDNGEPIDAWVRTFLTDFGTNIFKRAPDIFVGVTATGDMMVKVLTRDPGTGAPCEDWYSVVRKQEAGPAIGRVKVGRGLKSTWWGLELRNVDGGDFTVHAIEWRPIVLDRRQ
jgi:hypothetical protein